MAVLVEDYERRTAPPIQVDPVEAILFRMDQAGLTREDLIPYLGGKAKVSEVINRKRPLSRAMIQKLHAGLGIPLESLFGTAVLPAKQALPAGWRGNSRVAPRSRGAV